MHGLDRRRVHRRHHARDVLFGELADRWGVRVALLLSLLLMVLGRILLSGSPLFGGAGLFSPMMFGAVGASSLS
ncbi:MAG: hypothetical protein IPP94_18595 [Ignavibacteria bacterium]|nr:hypothetical protein [Ignavibacteria bacterium]